MRILGVDVGIQGGLAIWFTDNLGDRAAARMIDIIDVPTHGEKAKRRVDVAQLKQWLYDEEPDHAFVERAQAMPKQGSSSGFLYGRAVGAIEATIACCSIPMTIVEPSVWKRHHGLLRQDKEGSRQRALLLVPDAGPYLARKRDHGRAEALLIALYGATVLQSSPRTLDPRKEWPPIPKECPGCGSTSNAHDITCPTIAHFQPAR